MAAVWHLLHSAESEEAKKKALLVAKMTAQEVTALLEDGQEEEEGD